jgi:hypothetical protein
MAARAAALAAQAEGVEAVEAAAVAVVEVVGAAAAEEVEALAVRMAAVREGPSTATSTALETGGAISPLTRDRCSSIWRTRL